MKRFTSFAPLHYVLLVVLLHWYPSTRSWGREAPRDPGYDGVSGRPCSLAEMAIPDAVDYEQKFLFNAIENIEVIKDKDKAAWCKS